MRLPLLRLTGGLAVALLAVSCAASVSGDLAGPGGVGSSLAVKAVRVSGLSPYHAEGAFAGLAVRPGAPYDELTVDYLPAGDDWWGEFCVWGEILTVGIVPLYSWRPLDVRVTLTRDGAVVFTKTYRSRLDVWYGWLPLALAEQFPGPGQVSVDEGSGLEGARIRAVSDRLVPRLQADLFPGNR